MFKFLFASKSTAVLASSLVAVTLFVVVYRYWSSRVTPEKILAGRELFEHKWTPNDPLSGGDGLGPVFNDTSCAGCHFQGGVGGGGTNVKNVHKFLVLPTADRPAVVRGVIHHQATDESWQEEIDQIQERYLPLPGQTIRNGCYTSTTPPISPVVSTSINTPALFGLGLIEQIPSYAIAYHGTSKALSTVADEFRGQFSSGGIGRIRMSGSTVGKFGWQGEFGTIHDFVAEACAVELGLSVPGRLQDKPGEYTEDDDARYDLSRRQLHEMVCFVKSLPRPVQVLPEDSQALATVRQGQAVFGAVGCAECHVPDIGGVQGIYSDFHLYNLSQPESDPYAEVLSNDRVQFPLDETAPNEWKTPPLWGVADSAPYFHDGTADTLEAAINLHHGDAEYSRQRFQKASLEERRALIAFLETLKAPDMEKFLAQVQADKVE